MTQPAIISIHDVSKRFVLHKDKSVKERILNLGRSRKHLDDFWALRNVNLDINLGSTVGLLGHNGSGKSTLLKVIGGIIEPTSGLVARRGRMAALLELGAGFHPDLTGRENVYLNSAILGLTKKQTDRYFDAIVDFSGVEEFIDTQVKFYSSGMYVRLAFAVAVHVDPDFLLVDEVLAVGDEPFQRRCTEKIAEFQREGRTIVLVSHSVDQVEKLCDRVVVLDHGKLVHDGSSEEGIRVLRSGFERDRLITQEARGLTSERGALILDIKSNLRLPSEDLCVIFSYQLTKNFKNLVAQVKIETPAGQEVFGIDTSLIGLHLSQNVGKYEVTFTLRNQSIGAGHYIIRGYLFEGSGQHLSAFQAPSILIIEPKFPGSGVIAIDATAEVTSVESRSSDGNLFRLTTGL